MTKINFQNPTIILSTPKQNLTFRGKSNFPFLSDSFILHTKTNKVNITTQRNISADRIDEAGESNQNFSNFENAIRKNPAIISSFKQEGLPLKYSRRSFIKNLNAILLTVNNSKKKEILNNLGIEIVKQGWFGKTGYDGILQPSNLDLEDETQKQIYDECVKFLYQNRVQTGNRELDKALNTIIKGMPEFINTIGKKQHKDQDYSVDIHSLMVLCGIINNPDYKKLTKEDKLVLKMTALFHDIGKSEFIKDPEHPFKSYKLVSGFVEKFNFPPNTNDRILKSIKNHQWLQWYNNSAASLDIINNLVNDYATPNDYTMALIMTRADLAATSKYVSTSYSPLLDDMPQQPLRQAVEEKFDTRI